MIRLCAPEPEDPPEDGEDPPQPAASNPQSNAAIRTLRPMLSNEHPAVVRQHIPDGENLQVSDHDACLGKRMGGKASGLRWYDRAFAGRCPPAPIQTGGVS